MQPVDFYFDFLSPFSFFAWHFRNQLSAPFNPKPIVLAKILNHWGTKGPAEIESKREFQLRQVLRMAKDFNIEFATPKTHPFNPLYALRIVTGAPQEHRPALVDTLFRAGWQSGLDMGDPETLQAHLEGKGFDGAACLEASFSREAKLGLKANTKEAIDRGVFGVPTYFIGDELFWGLDSLTHAQAVLDNGDQLDREGYELLLANTPKMGSQSLQM